VTKAAFLPPLLKHLIQRPVLSVAEQSIGIIWNPGILLGLSGEGTESVTYLAELGVCPGAR
jgi:hypothetical protein